MRTVHIDLGERSYPIHIDSGLLDDVGRLLHERCPAPTTAVISDQTVADLYAERVMHSVQQAGYRASLLVVPPGEASKSLQTAASLYDRLAEAMIERRSPVVALGGGMVGDLAGFVAATWLRGVPFAQVPTTLVADVDASVGGKTAVNHSAGKNLIGAFYQPRLVLIDPTCLATLAEVDRRAGLAESVKHAVIRDPDFFEWHERNVDRIASGQAEVLGELIERNCRIKASFVCADEREESGLRASLNFGHTVGHAIEAELGYELRHGECVAVGMVAAAWVAVNRRMLQQAHADRIKGLIAKLGLPTKLRRELSDGRLLELMRHDKKVRHGRVRLVLPTTIGHVELVDDVTTEELLASLAKVRPTAA